MTPYLLLIYYFLAHIDIPQILLIYHFSSSPFVFQKLFLLFFLNYNIIIMFTLCSACSSQSQGPGFVLNTQNKHPQFYRKVSDLKQQLLLGQDVSLFKVESCPKFIISKRSTKPFVDSQFPPESGSLGNFQSFQIDKWKRLPQVLPNSSLFGQQLQVKETNNPLMPLCMSLTACFACLAQKEFRLFSLINQSRISPTGIYDILLRCNGQIKQITIDDFVPISQSGNLCFSPSLNFGIWSSLIQKARAKFYGSYEKMIENSQDPKLVLQEITWAPSYSYLTSTNSQDLLWQKIQQATNFDFPCLTLTSSNENLKWNQLSLTRNHFYNLLDSQTLKHKLGCFFRVVKLRNCFNNQQYKGQGSLSDTLFWQQIQSSLQKSKILSNVGSKEGIFYMLFTDFIKYFQQIFVNHFQKYKKYLYNSLKLQKKSQGLIYQLIVKQQGEFHITIQQNNMFNTRQAQYQDQGYSRITLVLARNKSSKIIQDFEYVDGLFKYNQRCAKLKVHLKVGNYILYLKLDPTINFFNLPTNANIIVYSKSLSFLKQSSQSHFPDFLKLLFSSYGRANKRQFYNNDQMWSSWKLISKCGFGFISFGNSTQSKSCFTIIIDQEQLKKQNYKLKKPFKGKGIQQIHINPGQQKIILLRIMNSKVRDIKFPPPIKIQIKSIQTA